MAAASEMLVSERAPLQVVTHIGTQGLAGYVIPAFVLLCGVLLWFNPIDRSIYGLLAMFLSLGSWITSNIGGLFVGMVAGVVGGALAFAWRTDAEQASPGWLRGKPWIGWRSWVRGLISQVQGQWRRTRKVVADRQDPLTLLNSLLSRVAFLKTLASAARRRRSSDGGTPLSAVRITSFGQLKSAIRSQSSRIWRRRVSRAYHAGLRRTPGQFARSRLRRLPRSDSQAVRRRR